VAQRCHRLILNACALTSLTTLECCYCIAFTIPPKLKNLCLTSDVECAESLSPFVDSRLYLALHIIQLEGFVCDFDFLKSIEFGCPNVMFLDIEGCDVTVDDECPTDLFFTLKRLRTLNLPHHDILHHIDKSIAITSLKIHDVPSFARIAAFKSLQQLFVVDFAAVNLTSLQSLTSLTYLTLVDGAQLTSIDEVNMLPRLTDLTLINIPSLLEVKLAKRLRLHFAGCKIDSFYMP
jgi:hypothetical protein